jgi:hypothetical protein
MKYFLISLIFLMSCKKDKLRSIDCSNPSSDVNICNQLIVGKWNWSYEKFYDRINQVYIIKTPSSEGYTRMIDFKKGGLASFFKNSVFEKDSRYSVTTFDVVTGVPSDNKFSALIFYNIQTGSREDYVPITICNDTLNFNYNLYSDTKGQQKWAKN